MADDKKKQEEAEAAKRKELDALLGSAKASADQGAKASGASIDEAVENLDPITEAKRRFAGRFSSHLKVDPKGKVGFPKPVKKGSAEEDLVRMWKAQKRAFCKDERCYYPLNAKRLEEHSFEVQTVPSPSGAKLIVGECSYDPRHAGGVQLFEKQRRDGLDE